MKDTSFFDDLLDNTPSDEDLIKRLSETQARASSVQPAPAATAPAPRLAASPAPQSQPPVTVVTEKQRRTAGRPRLGAKVLTGQERSARHRVARKERVRLAMDGGANLATYTNTELCNALARLLNAHAGADNACAALLVELQRRVAAAKATLRD